MRATADRASPTVGTLELVSEGSQYNRVWIDGVEIEVASGDVSYVHEKAVELIDAGGGWFTASNLGAEYVIRVSPSSSVVIRYVDH